MKMKRHYSRRDEDTHDQHILELMRMSKIKVSDGLFLDAFGRMVEHRFMSWLRRNPLYRWTVYRLPTSAISLVTVEGDDAVIGQVMSEARRPIARAYMLPLQYAIDLPPENGLATRIFDNSLDWLSAMSEYAPLWEWKRETIEHKSYW